MKNNNHNGYRVDILSTLTGEYFEYTSLHQPITLGMAEALGRGLERQKAFHRIVEVTGKENHASEFVKIYSRWEPS
jgi:hypothetical protein